MANSSLVKLAYVLALLGGIIMIIVGILSFLGFALPGPGFGWGYYAFAYGGLVTLICGIIAVIGAKYATTIAWAIILIIVGIIGGTFGGILVVIAGIVGLLVAILNPA